MKRPLLGFLSLGFLLAACGNAEGLTDSTPSTTPNQTPSISLSSQIGTNLSELSPTPAITRAGTIHPSPTDHIPPQTDGPYLTYIRQEDDHWDLVFLDTDGVGRKETSLPKDTAIMLFHDMDITSDGRWVIFPLQNEGVTEEGIHFTEEWFLLDTLDSKSRFLNHSSLLADLDDYPSAGFYGSPRFSPDGKWLVYYYGMLPTEEELNFDDSYELTMKLLSLTDGEIKNQVNLLSPDFPASIEAESYASFLSGFDSHNWSPNGRYLAFAGAMDGPSSDIYLLDIVDQSVIRLTDGPGNIQWIIWSPDGNRILHSSTNDYCQTPATCDEYFVITKDGNSAAPIPDIPTEHGGFFYGIGWLTPSKYVFFGVSNGGHTPLRYFDLNRQRTIQVFPEYTTGFGGEIDYFSHTLMAMDYDRGVLWYDATTGENGILNLGLCGPDEGNCYERYGRMDFGEYRYFVSSDYDSALINAKGAGTSLGESAKNIWCSPDGQWMVSEHMESISFSLFDTQLQKIRDISLNGDFFYSLLWRPDSKGFFVHMDGNLFYFDLSRNKLEKVDTGLDDWGFDSYPLTWVAE
jgi:hypothetical protein